MKIEAIQDHYPDDFSHCYGCGRLNDHGLQIKTQWDGQKSRTVYRPLPAHEAVPGFVYGGLVASLIDCTGTGTADQRRAIETRLQRVLLVKLSQSAFQSAAELLQRQSVHAKAVA